MPGNDDLGGNFTSAPGISSWGSGRLDIFARGATTNHLFHKAWTGTAYTGWEDMGGTLESGPGAVSAPEISAGTDNHLDVYYQQAGGAVQRKVWNGSTWGSWQSTGLTAASGVGTASWGPERYDMVGLNANNSKKVQHWYWVGP